MCGSCRLEYGQLLGNAPGSPHTLDPATEHKGPKQFPNTTILGFLIVILVQCIARRRNNYQHYFLCVLLVGSQALNFSGFYTNHNKEAKSLSIRRGLNDPQPKLQILNSKTQSPAFDSLGLVASFYRSQARCVVSVMNIRIEQFAVPNTNNQCIFYTKSLSDQLSLLTPLYLQVAVEE